MTKGYEAVTVESLTDEQVDTLRREAAEAGDHEIVVACDLALGQPYSGHQYGTCSCDDGPCAEGHPGAEEGHCECGEDLSIDDARTQIVDAINDARAQG